MANVWPFRPGAEMIEVLAWQTDIIRSKADEQRIPLRLAPRTEYQMKHPFTHRQYAAARTLCRDDVHFFIPDWTSWVALGPVAAGSGVTVSVDVSDTAVASGDVALLWQSDEVFELVAITAAGGGSVTIYTVVGDYTAARLFAVRTGYSESGLQARRPAGPIIECDISFVCADTADDPASSYPTYRGHDLMTDCPIVADDSFDEGVTWPLATVDSGFGVPTPLSTRRDPDEKAQMRWHEFTRAGIKRVRQWLHSRAGSVVPFWYSSRGRDFGLAATIGSAATTMTIFAMPGITNLARSSFDIEIRSKAGSSYYRHISGVTTGSAIGGRPTLILTMSSALGVALAPADIFRISLLRFVRFDADRIEMLHKAGAGCAVSVPVIEAPAP